MGGAGVLTGFSGSEVTVSSLTHSVCWEQVTERPTPRAGLEGGEAPPPGGRAWTVHTGVKPRAQRHDRRPACPWSLPRDGVCAECDSLVCRECSCLLLGCSWGDFLLMGGRRVFLKFSSGNPDRAPPKCPVNGSHSFLVSVCENFTLTRV